MDEWPPVCEESKLKILHPDIDVASPFPTLVFFHPASIHSRISEFLVKEHSRPQHLWQNYPWPLHTKLKPTTSRFGQGSRPIRRGELAHHRTVLSLIRVAVRSFFLLLMCSHVSMLTWLSFYCFCGRRGSLCLGTFLLLDKSLSARTNSNLIPRTDTGTKLNPIESVSR